MANVPVVLGLTGDFNAAATALPPFAQGRGFGTEREVSGERKPRQRAKSTTAPNERQQIW
jgi:hypothetical protein